MQQLDEQQSSWDSCQTVVLPQRERYRKAHLFLYGAAEAAATKAAAANRVDFILTRLSDEGINSIV